MGRPKKAHEKLSHRATDLSLKNRYFEESRESRRHSPYYVASPTQYQPVASPTQCQPESPASPNCMYRQEVDEAMRLLRSTPEGSPMSETSITPQPYDLAESLVYRTQDYLEDSPGSSDSSSSYQTDVDIEDDLTNILCNLQQLPDSQLASCVRSTVQSFLDQPQDYSFDQPVSYPDMKAEPERKFTFCQYNSGQLVEDAAQPVSVTGVQGLEEQLPYDIPIDCSVYSLADPNSDLVFSETDEWKNKGSQSLYTQMYDSLITAYNISNHEDAAADKLIPDTSYDRQPCIG